MEELGSFPRDAALDHLRLLGLLAEAEDELAQWRPDSRATARWRQELIRPGEPS